MQIPFTLNQDSELPDVISLANATIFLYPHFLSATEADDFFTELRDTTPWQQDILNFGGKSVPVPRLQAWFGDKNSNYGYSGLALHPLPWTPLLSELKLRIEKGCKAKFNSVLLNYYRSGKDSVAWHSDDEKELGRDPLIASLSLGTSRRFELKQCKGKLQKQACDLGNGSLLVMGKGVQQHWQHQVPKQPEIQDSRINLTFRLILD